MLLILSAVMVLVRRKWASKAMAFCCNVSVREARRLTRRTRQGLSSAASEFGALDSLEGGGVGCSMFMDLPLLVR